MEKINQETKLLLKDYIEKSSNTPDVHWDPNLRNPHLRLSFNPYACDQKDKTAHYFLLVAAIDRPEYVLRSETTRALMIKIHEHMGGDCFKTGLTETFTKIINALDPYLRFGENKSQIPIALDSVNSYVEKFARNGLVEHSQKFTKPSELVQELSEEIPFFRGYYLEHTWMYIRWMTRNFPDFHVFEKFSPKDLQIPMTRYVKFVCSCMGFCAEPSDNLTQIEKMDEERKKFTEFAAEPDMFPDDPTVVDYPFYVLGRWLYGEKPSVDLLRKYLGFWQKIYTRAKIMPIEFDLIGRETDFEKQVREQLEKLNFLFKAEPHRIPFPKETKIPGYKPDFILNQCNKGGKIVILEPHDVWTRKEEKLYTLGGRTYSVLASPSVIEPSEQKFVEKLRILRREWGEVYYTVLILAPQIIDRVRVDYPDIADEICEAKNLPRLLYSLRENVN